MISLKFALRILTLPVAIAKAVVEYYTVGTIHSTTNAEFNTLFKNVHLAVENHLANQFALTDIPLVVYQPLSKIVSKFQTNAMAQHNVRHYGEQFHERSFWINKNDDSEHVVVYFHGGGYALSCFDAQFAGFMMLYHALSPEAKAKYSFLIVDYTLTFQEGGKFPTQIFQALQVYSQLIDAGYSKIHLLGDSAGANLCIAILRFLYYPEETQFFHQFSQFDFNQFSSIKIEPESCILISPWVQPLHITSNRRNINNVGDLGARTTVMGEWYIGDLEYNEDLAAWVSFSKIEAAKFDKIKLFSDNKTLVIYGDREVLRDGIEEFLDKADHGLVVHMEPGGIHVGLLYVESLDYLGAGGAKAISGDFDDKYGLHRMVQFLEAIT